MKPALAILAAGASTRLGTCKALAAITPHNALELLSNAGSVCNGAPVLVVSGADHAAIQRALPPGLALAWNTRWSSGRTSTVAVAASLRRGLDLCIAPVDVPLVDRGVFEALCSAWAAAGAPPRGWLAPRFASKFGHPIVLGRALLEELAGFEAGAPLSRLRARADPLLSVAVETASILDDLDTPADLEILRARSVR